MKKICIAYHNPYPSTIYATRYIYIGYKNAFEDMGHKFVTYSPGQDLKQFLETNQPAIFITASHFLYRKYLDYELLRRWRQEKGLIVLTKIDFWDSPLSRGRINEAPSMKDDKVAKDLIKKGLLGDCYFHVTSQHDQRMAGFAKYAGKNYLTIPLAADKVTLRPHERQRFAADISFIGTNLPQKRQFFKEWLLPLDKKYDLKLYGQDWKRRDRALGFITKVGQYFNIPVVKSLQKPPLRPSDEADIYASSKILVNIHEDYQRQYGGDCNERTFKIPFCGGLEICDNVAVVSEYFNDGQEIVIAKSKADWFDKIDYYYNHPKEAAKIAAAGQLRTARDHTYHNRVNQILGLINP